MERQFRKVAKQRRVAFFCDSPNGARAMTVIYSILNTAKLNGLKEDAYLAALLPELIQLNLPNWETASVEAKAAFYADFENLSPWSPYMQQICKVAKRDFHEDEEIVRSL